MTDVYPIGAEDPQPVPGGRHVPAVTAVICALVAAVLVGIFALVDLSSPARRAIRACEAWVTDQLVAPASAHFSGEQFYGGDSPRVFGDVDSQNGFGAVLRGSFSCSMVDSGGDW